MEIGGVEICDDQIRLARRADDLVLVVLDAIAAARPVDDLAAENLRLIERTIPEVPARLWIAVAALDLIMGNTIARVLEATVGLVSAGMASFVNASQLLAMFSSHFAGEIERRTLN